MKKGKMWKWENLLISGTSEWKLRIYPNSTNGELIIESSEFQLSEIQVFDVVGRELIKLSAINNKQTTLNVKSLDKGMYFLKIITEDGKQQIKKVVKY